MDLGGEANAKVQKNSFIPNGQQKRSFSKTDFMKDHKKMKLILIWFIPRINRIL